MRFLFFISAFILLGMSCLPCMDTLCKDGGHEYEQIAHEHGDDDQHPDHCSPLCFCSCCPGSPVYFIPGFSILTTSIAVESPRCFANFYVNPVKGVSSSVWQPPRA